ncbi:hypothetical protein D8674_042163 [Pyrus ussuriensis x Pyrus communis]|uniref:NAB domain-containing protein n=1 Tax=Pyrus ussuriensis x Pyrus communis TaxID=2448454 RepID=A0A5N5G808_9ROSA|nr:hypothetical protein D8674_042163 [Pyrus ussuriensis x Pyrus communis]
MGSISEEMVKKLEDQAASFSWWWDSHNRPNQSQWLEATLSELNQKTKLMLNIIEEDGDSFAKRAEMLFKRKPKLINMLEDFYKSYRSLAEKSFSSLNSLKVQTIQKCEKEISTYLKAKSLKAQVETDQESIEEHMEKENIDQGVESDGNVCGKDKMLDEKISELIDENMQQRAELIRRNKEKSETIERLLSQVNRLTDENINLWSHLGSHKDATDHTITRQNKPQFSRSKSKGPSFLGRLTGCTGT